MPGTEHIPQLMAESTLVCKGEVIEAPAPVRVASPEGMERMSAIANVKPDRCFKGKPDGGPIQVLFDGFDTGTGGSFVLRKGTYLLFFLKPQGGKFAVADVWFGALPISRKLGATPDGADPMHLLELDLEAGLRDSNPELVLDSIQMLGNMKHLQSTTSLKEMLSTPDLLVKTYVWQALLRLQDYTVLPASFRLLRLLSRNCRTNCCCLAINYSKGNRSLNRMYSEFAVRKRCPFFTTSPLLVVIAYSGLRHFKPYV